ncbi:metal ABC transporter solute-binding protein, Zn/Mn family [Atopobium deltae]|uniref:ABC transporter, substrate-binding protein n=1 Tax=Atopobium deltae TaxID=1393034 RepID=A0A133XW39_9ACTN|nr:zinc ABC transporter substrate-binding protein [Atopobium deltae]KXB35152.1 ABC transporter, substrate-binding protein [Atopobium deltae]
MQSIPQNTTCAAQNACAAAMRTTSRRTQLATTLLSFVLLTCLASFLALNLSGCAGKSPSNTGSNATSSSPNAAGKQTIYTTFFPVYDLTKRIVGDKMDVKMIIKGNQEPHDFELQAADMANISKARLIVYNGAGMENFIDDLKASAKDDSKFLDLSQGLTLLQSKDAKKDDHSSVNPHTWLSIKNALVGLNTIYTKLASIDPDNADYYKANYEKAKAEFEALDKKFTDALAPIPAEKRYFVVSHAAFNYLAQDYGLKQVAVTGISPEDEPSAAQLATIADFVKKHKISTIFFEGKATPKVADTLAKNTGTKTDTIYTMESLTEDEQKQGYLALMEHNLKVLTRALQA